MANKTILLRILVMVLVFGMIVVGCTTTMHSCVDGPVLLEEIQKDHQEDQDDFKVVNNKLDVLLKPKPLPQYPRGSRMVPVSKEIIERANAENIDLSRLDYHLSANITVYINETDDKLELAEGKLVETKVNMSEEIPITIEDKGEQTSSGKDFFDISFSEGNLTLRFERNTVRNRFDLVSASKRGKNYSLNFENEKPYLVINYPYVPNNKDIQVQGVGASALINKKNGFNSNGTSQVKPPQPPVETVNCHEKIEGRGTMTPAAVVQFIMERNNTYPRNFLEELIGTYFKEAGKLDINPDIAIAQMCYVTNFLRNEKAISIHNYAGFSTMPASGCFRSMEEGIQAHIQHLKGYANEKYKPSNIVDPRWEYISNFRGTADNIDRLAKIWSPNNIYYADEIVNIINVMRSYNQGRV